VFLRMPRWRSLESWHLVRVLYPKGHSRLASYPRNSLVGLVSAYERQPIVGVSMPLSISRESDHSPSMQRLHQKVTSNYYYSVRFGRI
jgi:hypothetical protein